MIRQTKKLFLCLLSLVVVFVIAGCGQNQASDKNSNNAQQELNTIAGEWQLTDIRNTVQKSFLTINMLPSTFGTLLNQFDTLDFRLKIEDGKADASYQFDLNKYAETRMKTDPGTHPDEKEFKKSLFKVIGSISNKYKASTVSLDESTGIFSYDTKGSVDESNKTITFSEGLVLISTFPFSNSLAETSYTYSLKNGLLVLSVDIKEKEDVPVHFELRFNRVGATKEKKEPVSLEGKWEALNFRDTAERAAGYTDYLEGNNKPTRLYYVKGAENIVPTLDIKGNGATYEYTVDYKVFIDPYLQNFFKDNKPDDALKKTYYNLNLHSYQTKFGKLKHHQFDFDMNQFIVKSVLKDIKIDATNQTITFPETPNILGLLLYGGKSIEEAATYQYSIDGDILTLTLEKVPAEKDINADHYPIRYEMKFKKIKE